MGRGRVLFGNVVFDVLLLYDLVLNITSALLSAQRFFFAGAKTGFVVTKTNDTFHAAAKDGKLYIGADSFENDTWERDLIHEYTHFEEGTKEYENLAKFLADKDLLIDTKSGKRALVEVAAESVLSKGYGFTAEEMNDIIEKKNAKEPLTAAEAAAYSVFNDELVAHSAEYLLGNEAFIDKLVAKDAPLARKIFDKLVDVCKAIGGKGASKTLKTAQKLYIKAAEKVGNVRLAKYFLSHAPELEDESLDSEEKVRYNRKVAKKTFYFQHENFPGKEPWREAHRLAIWWAKHDDVETGEQTLISMNDVWYVVEKFDDADNGYQVEERLTAAEYKSVRKEIDEYGRSGQIKSVQESTDFIDLLDQSGGSFEGRGSSADRIQPQHGRENQQIQQVGESSLEGRERPGGDEQGNRSSSSVHRQGKDVKFSLKDSTGDALTEAQAEYFKDSRVRDKDGNLLVVYHGSSEDFNVFDITKSRSYDESPDYDLPGFYFSESDMESGGYGDNVKAYYVNVTNPYGGNLYQLKKEKGSFRKAYDYLVSEGYDGFIDTEMGEGFTEIIAFHPEQAKLTTNKTPTKSNDIRFSRKARGGVGEDLYTATDRFVQEVVAADRDLFARSLANKTADMLAGEQRSILIFGRNLVYLFDADRYMNGKMVSVHSANEIERQNLRKRYLDETDNGGENVNRRSSFDESHRTRTGSNFSVFRNRRGTVEYDSVSYEPPKSDKSGDFRRDVSHRTYDAREVAELLRKLKQLYGIPEDGVKFSRKAPRPDGATYQISDGQVKKMIANYTRSKTYSKKEADEAIHEILTNILYSEDEQATLRGKSREEVVDMLWQGLNGAAPGKRGAVANKVADYIIEHAMLERVLEDINVQIENLFKQKAFRHAESLLSLSKIFAKLGFVKDTDIASSAFKNALGGEGAEHSRDHLACRAHIFRDLLVGELQGVTVSSCRFVK